MSQIYHTEPGTQGKVVLKTNHGDIDIELWPKEAPLACRNFVQLCLEGYFDHTSVHRIIKGFMMQMGDPTGTGKGGTSIWGRPFKDEIHGRIHFNHRGQIAMANENAPHTNQSQFFITLDACEWLNKKHTIFGKVTGTTIFNVVRMGEFEVGEEDRPVDPVTVNSVEVWCVCIIILYKHTHSLCLSLCLFRSLSLSLSPRSSLHFLFFSSSFTTGAMEPL